MRETIAVPQQIDAITSGYWPTHQFNKAMGTYPDGAIRVSPSFFTTDDEIDRFIYAVKSISESV